MPCKCTPMTCDFCFGDIGYGTEPYISWDLHEVSVDHWVVVCDSCVVATGLDEGK